MFKNRIKLGQTLEDLIVDQSTVSKEKEKKHLKVKSRGILQWLTEYLKGTHYKAQKWSFCVCESTEGFVILPNLMTLKKLVIGQSLVLLKKFPVVTSLRSTQVKQESKCNSPMSKCQRRSPNPFGWCNCCVLNKTFPFVSRSSLSSWHSFTWMAVLLGQQYFECKEEY